MTRKRNRTTVSHSPLPPSERKKRTLEGAEEPTLNSGRLAPSVDKIVGESETADRKERQNSVVFVGELSPETSVRELKSRFEGFRNISRVKIADKLGRAFITFRAKESAESAVKAAADPYGIHIRNKRVLVSWASDPLPRWKMGIGCSKRGKDVLTKELPSKIPHGREGRGGNREDALTAVVAAVGSREGKNKADAQYQGREVVAYDDLL